MIKLIVVRHGESIGNVKNVIDDNSSPKTDKNGLSEKGKLQAIDVAKKLKKYRFDLVIVSPFKRTIETLQPFLKNENLKLIYSDLTNERNAGIFIGKQKTAIKEYCIAHNIIDRVNFKPENGESVAEVYQRAKIFLDYLKNNFQDKTVLLCGHVNFLGCLDIAINNKKIDDYYSYKPLRNGEVKEYIL